MKAKIDMVACLTSDLEAMKSFFVKVLGFEILLEVEGSYIEFKHEGVRFALSTHKVMHEATRHESYQQAKRGQVLELAFRCETVEELDQSFGTIVEKGAILITPPSDMPWGQRTAFFADPDGNIHELFCDL